MAAETINEVQIQKFQTLEEAQKQAGIEAANTGAFSFPVVVFRQGTRLNLTGALPMSWIKTRLEARSARRHGSVGATKISMNRPEEPTHSRAIAKYLTENPESYILPPLTLNIQQRVNLYMVDYPSEIKPGYLVIPATAKAGITDGQHRRSGVSIALDEMTEDIAAEFGKDAVAVMVTCETDIDRIHQDFADASKTKPLPSSLLALYDRRNPANRLVIDMEKACNLFNGRIDTTSKTLSKRSTFLFLANQVRQLVKELLAGSYALPDIEFEKRARELLSTERQHQRALETYSDYINHLTGVIAVWREVAQLPVGELESSQIPQKRAEGWICLTATGLNLIGRIGHDLFSSGEKNWRAYADKLGAIDWRRSAEIWQGNIIQNNKIMTQQSPLKIAVGRVREAIGWMPLKPEGLDAKDPRLTPA